jgi:hypothetical protein
MRRDIDWHDVNNQPFIHPSNENAHCDTVNRELGSKQKGSLGHRERARGTTSTKFRTTTALLSILATAPGAMAQNCISLAGSQTCQAFNTSSFSRNSQLIGFLYVSPSPNASTDAWSWTNDALQPFPRICQ